MKDLTGNYCGSLASMGLSLILGMGLLYLCLRQPGRTTVVARPGAS